MSDEGEGSGELVVVAEECFPAIISRIDGMDGTHGRTGAPVWLPSVSEDQLQAASEYAAKNLLAGKLMEPAFKMLLAGSLHRLAQERNVHPLDLADELGYLNLTNNSPNVISVRELDKILRIFEEFDEKEFNLGLSDTHYREAASFRLPPADEPEKQGEFRRRRSEILREAAKDSRPSKWVVEQMRDLQAEFGCGRKMPPTTMERYKGLLLDMERIIYGLVKGQEKVSLKDRCYNSLRQMKSDGIL